jgi:hypothetical protein
MPPTSRIRSLRANRIRLAFEGGLDELPPKVKETIERDRATGMGWKHDGLAKWPTEEIIRRLGDLDIKADLTHFPHLAARTGSVEALEKKWTGGKERSDAWADFPLLAAEELWYRLLPELHCPETASRRLDEATLGFCTDSLLVPSELPARLALWAAVKTLLGYVARGEVAAWPAQFAAAQACSPIDYEYTLLEMVKQAGGSELDLAAEQVSVMDEVKPNSLLLGYLAISLARGVCLDQATATVEKNLQRFPGDSWAHEKAGEVYLLLGKDGSAVGEFRRALQLSSTAINWGALLDSMVNAVENWAGGPERESALSGAVDLLADEVPPVEAE